MDANDPNDPNYFRSSFDPQGNAFTSFPKSLPQDTVKYHIWCIDHNLDDQKNRSRLGDILKTSKELCKSLLKEYIWQRDAFLLSLVHEDGTWKLTGSTNFGDSVADEWLIVYILRELSKKFPDAWIRLYDTDGEFLLIEACDHLPGWLDPDIADNRVWLNKGQLSMIPPEASSSHGERCPLKIEHALDLIRKVESDPYDHLSHVDLMDREAFQRIRNYPAHINDNMHHSLVTLPRKVAYLLRRNAAYISPAIDAFYLRHPTSLQPLQQTDSSGLIFPPVDFVTTSLRFNRAGFAQVKGQPFLPPTSWKQATTSFLTKIEAKTADFSRFETGMKLTCGFEMLLRDPANGDKTAVREIKLLLEDLETGDDQLPRDAELSSDPKSQRDDDEAWMNVSMDDFDALLSGRPKGKERNDSKAFADRGMQEDLRRMTERFNKIMSEGEGLEDDDDDDDENDDDYDHDEEEEDVHDDRKGIIDEDSSDQEIDFDPQEFERVMADVLGFAPPMSSHSPSMTHHQLDTVDEGDEGDEEAAERAEEEEEEIRVLTARLESELVAAGAFELSPAVKRQLEQADAAAAAAAAKRSAIVDKSRLSENKGESHGGDEEAESDEEGDEVEIDFEAARELLRALEESSAASAASAGSSKASAKK